jgi:hypothetical protein
MMTDMSTPPPPALAVSRGILLLSAVIGTMRRRDVVSGQDHETVTRFICSHDRGEYRSTPVHVNWRTYPCCIM